MHRVHTAPPLAPNHPAAGWRRRLRPALSVLALLLAPLWPTGPAWPLPAAADLAAEVLDAVNGYRLQQGLALLQADAGLTTLALAHSQAMAQQGRLSHDGFPARFEQAARPLCVENLAFNHLQADALLAAWQASPAHHANLLAPRVRQVGIAVVDGYLTLLACAPAAALPMARRR